MIILTEFTNNTLSGNYLLIYDDYVSNMLVFYTTDFIIKKFLWFLTETFNILDNAQVVSSKENEETF
jgi:hypothetical protein